MASPRDWHEKPEYQYRNLSPILEETESDVLNEEVLEVAEKESFVDQLPSSAALPIGKDAAQLHGPLKDLPDEDFQQDKTNRNIDIVQQENYCPKDHVLHGEITEVAKTYQNATDGIKNTSDYLTNKLEDFMSQRSSIATLSIGKEAAPLLGSLKTLGDKILKEDLKDNCRNIDRNLHATLYNVERNTQQLESMAETMGKSIQNLRLPMDAFKENKPVPQENNSSDTDVSSFKAKDVVTSSPFGSFEKNDEENQEK